MFGSLLAWQSFHAPKAGHTAEEYTDAFRKGRCAIDVWVDDDKNRVCILHTATDEVKASPEVQEILQQHANFGSGLQEKLLWYLEFMVENRRKYYNAVAGRSR